MTNYVLVHGGFVGAWHWSDVARLLEEDGHRVEVPEQLPSSGPDPTALGDLAADVRYVGAAVEAVGEPVVLVGHSYSGAVVTEFADHPAVAHSVHVAAAWLRRGQSVMDLLAAFPLTWADPREDGTLTVTTDLAALREALCADVDPDRAEAGLRRLHPQSLSSLAAASGAPEPAHPTTYVICESDRAVPESAQEEMAAAADHVHRLPSSHTPMWSMPDRLAAVLSLVR